MKTKDKILQAALALFNEEGLDNVSLRRIAQELGISLGNLTYHYARRDDIVYALYLKLVEHFDGMFGGMRGDSISLDGVGLFATKVYDAFYAYRFLMYDFSRVMRTYPSIRKHYQELTLRRASDTLMLFQALAQLGWMKKEAFPQQFALLSRALTILADSFLPSAEFVYQIPEAERRNAFAQQVGALLRPYLTEKGIQLMDGGLAPADS